MSPKQNVTTYSLDHIDDSLIAVLPRQLQRGVASLQSPTMDPSGSL